ncbi:hypothetical protein [Bacillus alkalicellulosilyticus]|uniref:hypothetical protein n=1 Tax=Alkalihalobacterium alkalicellulosilyticum TaxID=1912214 RepID=UPI000996D0E3|nr:hypothetical protein [Bacillus alkalicellulosilyticus]
MGKQWLIIGVSSFIMVIVWVAVIFTLISIGDPEMTVEKEDTAISPEDVVIDLGQYVRTEEKNIIEEPIEEEVEKEVVEDKLIDLSKYDFSDVSTKEGVPIDKILTKLGLE